MDTATPLITVNRQIRGTSYRSINSPSKTKKKSTPEPKRGDIVRFSRKLPYHHFAVCVGDGYVIHMTENEEEPVHGCCHVAGSSVSGSGISTRKAVIREDPIDDVPGNDTREVHNVLDEMFTPFPPDEIVKRAEIMLGVAGYNLLSRNCEHFANYCRYGQWRSEQVKQLQNGVTAAVVIIAVVLYIVVIGLFGAAVSWAQGVSPLEGFKTLMITALSMAVFQFLLIKHFSFSLGSWSLGDTRKRTIFTKIGKYLRLFMSGVLLIILVIVGICFSVWDFYKENETFSEHKSVFPCNSSEPTRT